MENDYSVESSPRERSPNVREVQRKARRALFFARYEASKLGSRVIESEHMLLGMLREGERLVIEILRRFDVKPEEIRREIEGSGCSSSGSPRPPSCHCRRSRRRSSPTPSRGGEHAALGRWDRSTC
jgi:ATP-dependent Clp protease ATP-binding subunit ClpA